MKYTKEYLELLVSECKSVNEICVKLGLTNGVSRAYIKRKIDEYKIDTKHFTQYVPISNKKKTWRDYLVERVQKFKLPRMQLLRSMLEYGFIYKCNKCGCSNTWQHEELILEIDHINGNPLDNRPENLQFLCPNCHSQKTVKHTRKHLKRDQFLQNLKQKALTDNAEKINAVLDANIDFSKFGYNIRLAKILGIPPQYVKRWLQKYMPEFYTTKCFKTRRSN